MKQIILLFISLFILSCGSNKNTEEVTVRGVKAYIVKGSATPNDALLHFKTESGEYVAMRGTNTGGAGYDVGNCDWCYIRCIIFENGAENCNESCDISEDCDGLVPQFKMVKSISNENIKLFNAQ